MLRPITLICLFLLSVNYVFADEHLSVNLKPKGLKNLLKSTFSSYQNLRGEDSKITLPAGKFDHTITKDNLNNNPVIKELREFVWLGLNEDLKVHAIWEPIDISGTIDEDSLDFSTVRSESNDGFSIKFDIEDLLIAGARVEFCEYLIDENTCDETKGFYGRFENFEISLKSGHKISAVFDSSIHVEDRSVSVTFDRIVSNLIGGNQSQDKNTFSNFEISWETPKFFLNFERFYMPPPVLVLDGKRITLDITAIQNILLDQRDFLANSLTKFVGEFVAKDLNTILNEKLLKNIVHIGKAYRVLDYDRNKRYHELLSRIREEEGSRAMIEFMMRGREERSSEEPTPAQMFQRILKAAVYKAEYDLKFDSYNIEDNGAISVFFDSILRINKRRSDIVYTQANGHLNMSRMNYSQSDDNYDFAVAISEPLINSMLKISTRSSIAQSLFNEFVNIKGVYIGGLNLHFSKPQEPENQMSRDKKLTLVASMRVRINELETNGMWDGIKNSIGSFIEGDVRILDWFRYGLDIYEPGQIWFPIEIDLETNLVKEFIDGEEKTFVSLTMLSPFDDDTGKLKNTYGYSIKEMSPLVRNSLYKSLRESLSELLGKENKVDITNFTKAIPGVVVEAKHISINDSGYICLGFDIEDVNVDELGVLNAL